MSLVARISILTAAFATAGALLALQQWNRPSVSNTSDNPSVSERPFNLGIASDLTVPKTPTDLHPEPLATHVGVWSVTLSPDGSLAASASENNTIILWDTNTWERKRAGLIGHTAMFSPDGNLLAAGGADNKIRLWDSRSAKQIDKEPPFRITKPVYRMAFSADSGSLALFTAELGKGDTDIQLWDLRSNDHLTLKGQDGIALMAIVFSPSSNVLFSTAQDNKLRSWNLTEKTSEVLQTYPKALKALVFSPDGKYLACASEDQTIKLWSYNAQTRKWLEQRSLNLPNSEIISLAFSPDGTTLVITGTNNSIYLWDVAAATSQPIVIQHAEVMQRSPAFSSEPQMFLTVGGNTIWRWR